MRFYLDCATKAAIREAAALPYVSGITTNPAVWKRDQVSSQEWLLDEVCGLGRRDWKLWVQLASTSRQQMLEQADLWSEKLSARVGNEFAGPTLVFKIMPTTEGLFAASTLMGNSREVCITGIAGSVQALAALSLPKIKNEEGKLEILGPPAGRQPWSPHYLAAYVGRMNDHGDNGILRTLEIARLIRQYGLHTRVLAASVRTRQSLDQLLIQIALAKDLHAVDVTLQPELLFGLLAHPVTEKAAEQFLELERS